MNAHAHAKPTPSEVKISFSFLPVEEASKFLQRFTHAAAVVVSPGPSTFTSTSSTATATAPEPARTDIEQLADELIREMAVAASGQDKDKDKDKEKHKVAAPKEVKEQVAKQPATMEHDSCAPTVANPNTAETSESTTLPSTSVPEIEPDLASLLAPSLSKSQKKNKKKKEKKKQKARRQAAAGTLDEDLDWDLVAGAPGGHVVDTEVSCSSSALSTTQEEDQTPADAMVGTMVGNRIITSLVSTIINDPLAHEGTVAAMSEAATIMNSVLSIAGLPQFNKEHSADTSTPVPIPPPPVPGLKESDFKDSISKIMSLALQDMPVSVHRIKKHARLTLRRIVQASTEDRYPNGLRFMHPVPEVKDPCYRSYTVVDLGILTEDRPASHSAWRVHSHLYTPPPKHWRKHFGERLNAYVPEKADRPLRKARHASYAALTEATHSAKSIPLYRVWADSEEEEKCHPFQRLVLAARHSESPATVYQVLARWVSFGMTVFPEPGFCPEIPADCDLFTLPREALEQWEEHVRFLYSCMVFVREHLSIRITWSHLWSYFRSRLLHDDEFLLASRKQALRVIRSYLGDERCTLSVSQREAALHAASLWLQMPLDTGLVEVD